MVTIEQIPADELVAMTEIWHRAFNAAGCDPMCHCCKKMIAVGERFHLGTIEYTKGYHRGYNSMELEKRALLGEKVDFKTIAKEFWTLAIRKGFEAFDTERNKKAAEEFALESKEVMLCDKCTPEKYKEKQLAEIDEAIKERDKPRGGCYRINGKIVH